MSTRSNNLRKYRTANPLVRTSINHFIGQVQALVNSLEADQILDVGCGEGFVMSRFCDRQVYGVDISLEAIAFANRENGCSRLVAGTVYQLPFRDESFDLVLALETLEHLEDPEQALLELRRVTSKYCILSVPYEPYFSAANVLRGKNLRRLGSDPEHRQKWGVKSFSHLINKHFEISELKTPFPWILITCKKL